MDWWSVIGGAVGLVLLAWALTWFVGAQWFPTPVRKIDRMFELAGLRPGELVYDLGCGDGRVALRAWRRWGARAVGVDINPFWVTICQFKARLLGAHRMVEFRLGNIFDIDVAPADVVTLYLLQRTNERLQDRLASTLRPDARVASHKFTMPGWKLVGADETERVRVYRPPQGTGGRRAATSDPADPPGSASRRPADGEDHRASTGS